MVLLASLYSASVIINVRFHSVLVYQLGLGWELAPGDDFA
jgi:hypothetical protein